MFKVPLLPSRSEKYLYDPKDPLQRAMKQKIFALSRCLWVNHVRLDLFEAKMAA